MKHLIHSAEGLGFALRAVRKSAKVRLDDLSQTVGVSKQTTTHLEQGKPTVQLGTAIRLLAEIGLTLSVELPESALPALRRVQAQAHEQGRRAMDPTSRGADASTGATTPEDSSVGET